MFIIIYITFFLLGTSANAQNIRGLRIRRPCYVLSPCNIANIINECSRCEMNCITWRDSTGYCFPAFRRNHMEDDFNDEREDSIEDDLSKGRHSVQDPLENDSNKEEYVQESLEDNSNEGEYVQDSLENNSNEGGYGQDSLEDNSNEKGYVQHSLEDNSNEGEYVQDSLENNSNEG